MAVRLHKRKKKIKKRAHNIDASKRKIVIEEILLWKCNMYTQTTRFLFSIEMLRNIQNTKVNFQLFSPINQCCHLFGD
jgi:hypothetical protein